MNDKINIQKLERINSDYVRVIAKLHKKAFPSFFLTQLGIPFLYTLYKGYIEDPESGIITAEKDSELVGFIAYSFNYSDFFKGLIKNHIIEFALCSISAVIKHPSFFRRILGAFTKSESVRKEEKYVELASICVDPKFNNLGIGSLLIDYLKSIVDFSIYNYINLETDADANDDVNRFYMKNGFRLSRQYTTNEGRRMNEYRFFSGETE